MAVPKTILEATHVVSGLAGSTTISRGDLVYDDGTDWELADASALTTYAMAVAVSDAPIGGNVLLARSAVLFDGDDNSFSSNTFDTHYLSATAGEQTATRPTGANDLAQVIGHSYKAHGGTGSQILVVDIRGPHEQTISVTPMVDSAASAAILRNLDFLGVESLAAGDIAGYTFQVPQNAVGLEIAYLWWTNSDSSPVLDASDTYTIDVSGGKTGDLTSATTDGITATALTQTADNDLQRGDVSAAFNTAGIIEAGNIVGVDVDKAAEGAGGDDPIFLSLVLVFNVV